MSLLKENEEINSEIESKIETKINVKVVIFLFSSVSINLSSLVYGICTKADFQITLLRKVKWHITLIYPLCLSIKENCVARILAVMERLFNQMTRELDPNTNCSSS